MTLQNFLVLKMPDTLTICYTNITTDNLYEPPIVIPKRMVEKELYMHLKGVKFLQKN